MEFVRRIVLALVALSILTSSLGPLDAAPGNTTRIPAYPQSQFSTDADAPAISADGRWVAFVVQQPGGYRDVFLHDRQTAETVCVTAGADGDSRHPALSSDGRYVAFETDATNLVPGDSDYQPDVLVYDRITTSLVLVSVGGDSVGDGGWEPAISADGRYVAFTSRWLSPELDYPRAVFVRDLVGGSTLVASSAPDGSVGAGHSGEPAISADGQTVAFTSHAAFDPADVLTCSPDPAMASCADVYVKDLSTGVISRASARSGGGGNNGSNRAAAISADGGVVAFSSTATDLVPGDTNGVADIFVHDRSTGTTTRVSIDSEAREGNRASSDPSLSGDGRFVVFTSAATNLASDTNRVTDLFRHDRTLTLTTRFSVNSFGDEADDASDQSTVAGDGATVAFSSRARQLAPDDANLDVRDIYVHEADARTPTRLVYSGPDHATVGDEIAVTATLRDALTNAPSAGAEIKFELREDGTVVRFGWAWTDSDGLASTTMMMPDSSGTFEMVAFYDGSADQQKSSSVRAFTVGRHAITITYTGDVTGVPGRWATVAASLTDESEGPVSGANVVFSLKDGDSVRAWANATTGPDGVAQTSMPIEPPLGEYVMEASFHGGQESAPATDVAPFSIALRSTTIVYTGDTTVVRGQLATLMAVLTQSDTSAPIPEVSVLFEIRAGGETVAAQAATTGANGIASAEVPPTVPIGTYTVRASYAGGTGDSASADEKPFTVTGIETSISYLGPTLGFRGGSVELAARLETANGTSHADRPVRFLIGSAGQIFDSVTTMTDSDGRASATITLQAPAGSHTVEARFDGTEDLNASADSRPFTVHVHATTLSYNGASTGAYDTSVVVSAVLAQTPDATPMAGERVLFMLKDGNQVHVQVDGTTNSQGVAQTALPLLVSAGTYTIEARFEGTFASASSSDARPFTVTHRDTTIVYNGGTRAITGEPILLSAALTRNGGGAIQGRLIVFAVISNGSVVQSAQATTNGSGIASVSPQVQVPAGSYRVETRFSGDAFFASSSSGVDLVIDPRGSTLTATAPVSGTRGQRVVVTGTLKDTITGLAIAGKTLQFTLGNTVGQATTDGEGGARLEVTLNEPPGHYALKVTFAGDGFHVASEATAPVEIRWEYTFVDSAGRGVIYLNPSTKEFRFVSPYEVGNIEYDSNMWWAGVNGRTIVINAYYDVDITLSGTFELETGRFQATVSTSTRQYVLNRF